MNIADTIRSVLTAAQNVTAAIPGLQGVSGLAGTAASLVGVGEGLVKTIDDLIHHAPDTRTQVEMQATRAALAARVTAKAESLADRLEG